MHIHALISDQVERLVRGKKFGLFDINFSDEEKSFEIYREMQRFYSMLVYFALSDAFSGLDKRASFAWNSYNTKNVLEMKRLYSMLMSLSLTDTFCGQTLQLSLELLQYESTIMYIKGMIMQ